MTARWQVEAACAGLTHIMFPTPGDVIGHARACRVCDVCPVQGPCLEYALTLKADNDGVYAHTTPTARRRMRRQFEAAKAAA